MKDYSKADKFKFYDSSFISDKNSDFVAKHTSMIKDLKTTFNNDYIYRVTSFILNYPKVELSDIVNGTIKIPKNEKKLKISRLENLLYALGEIGQPPDEKSVKYAQSDLDEALDESYYDNSESQKTKLENFLSIMNTETSRYKLHVFSPRDTYDKIAEWAKEVGICWGPADVVKYSQGYVKDIKEFGGTIIFTAKYGRKPVLFGRDFICVDQKGEIYLFMDNLEGLNFNHLLSDWVNGYPGAFKVALAASFFFAEKMGCKYIVAGDEGAEEAFVSVGTSKRTVTLHGKNIKVGYPARFSPADNGEIKSLSFDQEKYHYMRLV